MKYLASIQGYSKNTIIMARDDSESLIKVSNPTELQMELGRAHKTLRPLLAIVTNDDCQVGWSATTGRGC